jgi:hypothetical protein
MNARTTVILVLIAIALGGFVLLANPQGPSETANTTPAPTSAPPLLALDPEAVSSITITGESATAPTTAVKDDTGLWHLVSPTRAPADGARVSRFLSLFASLTPTRVLERAGAPSEYALDPPSIRIELELQDGTRYEVRVGVQTISGSTYYAQIAGDERVYLVSYSVGYDAAEWLTDPPVAPTPTPAPIATMPVG